MAPGKPVPDKAFTVTMPPEEHNVQPREKQHAARAALLYTQ